MKNRTKLILLVAIAFISSSFHINSHCYYRIMFSKGFNRDTVSFSINGMTLFSNQYLTFHPTTGNTNLSIFLLPESDSTISVAQQNRGESLYNVWDQTVNLGKGWEGKDISFDFIINKKKHHVNFKPSGKKYFYIHKQNKEIIVLDSDTIFSEE